MKQKIAGLESIEWLILITDHYDQSRAFYKEILGLRLQREAPEEHFAQFQMKNNCYLALFGRKEMTKILGARCLNKPGGAVYAFAETENVDKTFRELKSRGVEFVKEPTTQPWGQRTAYFRDPDGHIWEIQQWLKGNS